MQFHVRTYKTKSVVIESVLLTASNAEAVRVWCGGVVWKDKNGVKGVEIKTSSGVEVAGNGDYVIKYGQGEFVVMDARQFNLLFELTNSELARDGDMWPEQSSEQPKA